MTIHRKISVEEILADTGLEGYRVDGFRILAKMIARRYMSDGSPAQMSTSDDKSRPKDLSETVPANEDN
jgi:hypothetical protein